MKEERAADIITRDLEHRIISGQLPDNSPLPPEKELGREYGASRTVIREVITALTNRGMLENRPRFRPVVRKPGFNEAFDTIGGIVQHLTSDDAGLKSLYDSRIFVERMLVREAANKAKTPDIRTLRLALLANQQAIEDSETFYVTDREFHRVLYLIPGNPVFPALHRSFAQWLMEPWSKMEPSPERNARNFDNHQAIFDAILERDADLAETLMERHLQEAWEQVRDTIALNRRGD